MPVEAFIGLPEGSGIQEFSLRNDLTHSLSIMGGKRRMPPHPHHARETEPTPSVLHFNAFTNIIAIIINIIIAIIIAG